MEGYMLWLDGVPLWYCAIIPAPASSLLQPVRAKRIMMFDPKGDPAHPTCSWKALLRRIKIPL